jgi:hypothetical protein
MFRVACAVTLVTLMAAAPVAADSARTESASTARTGSSGKRVLWTVVGAAAGFGAGVFLGLAKFDDAIDSDRKVWTTALLTAAAGGIAGNLLSRDVGPRAGAPAARALAGRIETVDVSWADALSPTGSVNVRLDRALQPTSSQEPARSATPGP